MDYWMLYAWNVKIMLQNKDDYIYKERNYKENILKAKMEIEIVKQKERKTRDIKKRTKCVIEQMFSGQKRVWKIIIYEKYEIKLRIQILEYLKYEYIYKFTFRIKEFLYYYEYDSIGWKS